MNVLIDIVEMVVEAVQQVVHPDLIKLKIVEKKPLDILFRQLLKV